MLTSRTLPPSLKAIPSNVASERPRKPWSPSRVVPDSPTPILPPALQARYVLPSGYVAGDRRDASPSPTTIIIPPTFMQGANTPTQYPGPRRGGFESRPYDARGRYTVKVDPSFGVLSTVTRPP